MVQLMINGSTREFDVTPDVPLLWVLRDVAHLTGTKFGCGMALCGACTVQVDGHAKRACVLPAGSLEGKHIVTIEGIGATQAGQAVQAAWLAVEVVQCGYCQPGQIVAAATLLAGTAQPTDADIDNAMSGNICRCGTYPRIREAIKHAARLQASKQA